MKRRLELVFVVAFLAGCHSSPETPAVAQPSVPAAQDDGKFDFSKVNPVEGVEEHVLSNGLTVLLKQDTTLPYVTLVTAFKVGGGNDPEGLKGVAHFFEHMMFNGTTEFDKLYIDNSTYQAAGSNNAYTSSDATVYWFHISREALESFIKIEATRMTKLVFDTFDTERHNVMEELNRDVGSPDWRLYYELEPRVFTVHPYHTPVIGTRKDLEGATREKMEAFYHDYYAPNNATLVIHGDFDKTQALEWVNKYFGSLPKGKEAAVITIQEPPQTAPVSHEFTTEDNVDRMIMAWKTTSMGSDDDIALDLLSTILTGSKTARINIRLIKKDELVPDGGVSASNESRRYLGMFTVAAQPLKGKQPKQVEEAVHQELAMIADKGVAEPELQKAKNILLAHTVYQKESGQSLADSLGYSYAVGLRDYVRTYLGRVDRITADQIRAVAMKYLGKAQSTVVVARGKGQGSDKDGLPKPNRRCRRSAGRLTGDVDIGQYWDVRLPNGLTLLIKPKPGLPVVALSANVDVRAEYEPEDKAGIAAFTGDMLDEGTQDPISGKVFTDEQLASAIEEIGGSLGVGAAGVSMKALSRHTPLLLDILHEILVNASIPKVRFDAVKRDTLQAIEARSDDPETVVGDLFDESVFKGHPSHRPAIGYKETIEKLTREDVVAWYRKYFRPDNTVIAICGDVDPMKIILEIRQRFAGWAAEGTLAPVAPVAAPSAKEQKICSTKKIPQVNIRFGQPGITRHDPDFAALRVAETIFCSSPVFSDRLSQSVRVKGGLAYSVYGSFTRDAGFWPGSIFLYVGTESKNKDKVTEVMLKMLKEYVEMGPTEKEVADAKNYITKSFFNKWETTDNWVDYLVSIKRLNLGTDLHRRYRAEIMSLTRDQVHEAIRRHVKPDQLTTIIVGPVDKEGNLKQDK